MVDPSSGVGMVVMRTIAAAVVVVTLVVTGCSDSTSPSKPSHLAFTVEPSDAAAGGNIVPGVAVAVRDDAERTVWSWTDTVRLSLDAGMGSATLLGTTSVAAVSGTAVFQGLRIVGIGEGYRLVATSGTLPDAVSQPFTVHEVFTAQSVTADDRHTCALDADGTAYCWGSNWAGQLGDGTTEDRTSPTAVAGGHHFVAVTGGSYHTCAVTVDGRAYCWGDNSLGELGNGSTNGARTPYEVSFGSPFVAIDAGWYHTCGLTADGRAYCWGDNGYGQLGDGTDSSRTVPTLVAGDPSFATISGGYQQTCGLTADGTAYCWGGNLYGEVGDSTFATDEGSRLVPTAVVGSHRFVSLTAGGGPCHGKTCGITTDGTTLCWGRSYQISGVLFGDRYRPYPTAIDGDPGFTSLTVGGLGACGVTAGGALYCWGDGFYGQIGTGDFNSVTIPTLILPDLAVVSVSMGEYHTCAVTAEGATYCWGDNSRGQLGNGSSPVGWAVPVPVWKP